MLTLVCLLLTVAPLTDRLEAWRTEVERNGEPVVVVRVETDRETGRFRVSDERLAPLLAREGLAEQFRRTQAMTINFQGADGRVHFVALNLDRAAEFQDGEEALLAHELGHAWLDGLGLRSLDTLGEERPCLAIHASDIVQHVLIRREMARRGIRYHEQWIRNLEAALEALGPGPSPAGDACDKLARLALWIDVRLGLFAEDWNRSGEFDRACRRAFPDLAAPADEIVEVLRAVDLAARERYQRALIYVRKRLEMAAGVERGPGMLLF